MDAKGYDPPKVVARVRILGPKAQGFRPQSNFPATVFIFLVTETGIFGSCIYLDFFPERICSHKSINFNQKIRNISDEKIENVIKLDCLFMMA